MLMHGGATGWERVSTWCVLACSPSARASYRRFATVSAVLKASLADRDDLIEIRLPKRRSAPAKTGMLVLLGMLTLIVFFEWKDYTIPVLMDAIRAAAHRCGIG